MDSSTFGDRHPAIAGGAAVLLITLAPVVLPAIVEALL